ncbi:MAG: ribosome recycling factor [Actinomycetaceae bacterium]|nr:ribosome recycling factor [Actinomycetaceae bacterium]
MIEEIQLESESDMEKAVEFATEEFANIRTGRANTAMFASIPVEYYGAPTPLQQLASMNIPEARTVLITPFDRSAMNDILKAIRESDLGVNPTDDGHVIRVTLPALTEERRKEYVKLARTKAEDARIGVRGARRSGREKLEAMKKEGAAGEDAIERALKELDEKTKSYTDKVDRLLEAKETELLTI